MAKTIYRVYGMDTYDHETFTVADFDTREEAEAKLRECRESVMDQCEELRDSFWITEMTHKQQVESQKHEEELNAALYAARAFDKELLEENCKSLIDSIKSQLNDKSLSYCWDGSNSHNDAEAEVIPEKEVCYSVIAMHVFSMKNGRIAIQMKPYFHEITVERIFASFDSEEEFRYWLNSSKSVMDSILTMVDMIEEYV